MPKLVDKNTQQEIKPGDTIVAGDGDRYTLISFTPPHKPSSTGRVYVKLEGSEEPFGREFFPTVFDAEIREA